MEIVEALAAFGSDWWYVVAQCAIPGAVGLWLVLHGRGPRWNVPLRFSDGCGRVTGLPAWSAGPLVFVLGFVLPGAFLGFLWDVAWHIDVGRDEFLLSPPHVFLLLGTAGMGVAGALSTYVATRTAPDTVGWKVRRWRVPLGAAGLLAAGALAVVGFWIDEFWHAIYGLDVTMWSPPHLTMISSAAFSPFAIWLLLSEAGPGAGRAWVRRAAPAFIAGVLLIALSAWQLEFDLGVPQWQQRFQPILIAAAAGTALVAARVAVGRGGALFAVAWFLLVRGLGALATTQVWELSEPRFPLYLGAAVAVEVAFLLTRERSHLTRWLTAGVLLATVGLATEWSWSHVWGYHPWSAGMWPGILIAAAAGIAAAVLGGAYGQVVSHRPSAIRWRGVTVSLAVIALALAVTLPRHAPDADIRIEATSAGDGRVDLVVEVDPPHLAVDADRWEVMAWQGDGRELASLEPTDVPGRYVAASSMPVGGSWKTVVRLASGPFLGAAPVALPADPDIGASAIPLQDVREQPFQREQELLLREQTDGPWWPGFLGTIFIAFVIGGLLAVMLVSVVTHDRRRRAFGWGTGSPVAGARILVTGAAGGIGRATVEALERHGAQVVGLDLVGDGVRTLACDVTDPDAVEAAVEAAVARLGGLDAVVANAGVGDAQLASVRPDADARRILEVNLWGSWHTVAAAVGHLGPGGRIIGVTSGLARAVVPYTAAYSASKRAFAAHLDVLRMELELDGREVTVTEVLPAFIRTAIHDVPARHGARLDGLTRVETVDDAVAAIVGTLEARRRWIGSSPLTSAEVWAAHHLPAAAHRVVARRARRVEARRGRPTFGVPDPGPTDPPDPAPLTTARGRPSGRP